MKTGYIMKANPANIRSFPNRPTLEEFFRNNVVELYFTRRIKPEWFIKHREVGHMRFQRRMLCTSNWRFISSPYTRDQFNWVKPKERRGSSWYRQRNLIITWDLMLNDWRMISFDVYTICAYTPCATLEDQAAFIAFYRENIMNISETEKKSFSDKI